MNEKNKRGKKKKKKRTLEPKCQSAKKEPGPKNKEELEQTKKTKGKKRKRNSPSNRSGFRVSFESVVFFFNETYLLTFRSFFFVGIPFGFVGT